MSGTVDYSGLTSPERRKRHPHTMGNENTPLNGSPAQKRRKTTKSTTKKRKTPTASATAKRARRRTEDRTEDIAENRTENRTEDRTENESNDITMNEVSEDETPEVAVASSVPSRPHQTPRSVSKVTVVSGNIPIISPSASLIKVSRTASKTKPSGPSNINARGRVDKAISPNRSEASRIVSSTTTTSESKDVDKHLSWTKLAILLIVPVLVLGYFQTLSRANPPIRCSSVPKFEHMCGDEVLLLEHIIRNSLKKRDLPLYHRISALEQSIRTFVRKPRLDSVESVFKSINGLSPEGANIVAKLRGIIDQQPPRSKQVDFSSQKSQIHQLRLGWSSLVQSIVQSTKELSEQHYVEDDIVKLQFRNQFVEKLSRYEADIVGRRDVSLPAANLDFSGIQNPDRMSSYSSACSDVSYPILKSLCHALNGVSDADSLFSPAVPIRKCWCFSGPTGSLAVRFKYGRQEHIGGFAVEHYVGPLATPGTSPKHIRLYGLEKNHPEILLGDVFFDIRGPPIQFAHAFRNTTKSFEGFKVLVLSNHGSDTMTCIHRLRILQS